MRVFLCVYTLLGTHGVHGGSLSPITAFCSCWPLPNIDTTRPAAGFLPPPSVMAPTFCPLASEIPQGNSSMKIGHMAEICLHLSAIAKCNPCVQYKCKYLMLELKGLPLVLLVGLQRHLSYFLLETHELDGLKEWTLKPLFSWFQEDEKL